MVRLNTADKDELERLAHITQELMTDIRAQSQVQAIRYQKIGTLRIQSTYPRLSKAIIDRIDTALAQHYGFTNEDLDFIINYGHQVPHGAGWMMEDTRVVIDHIDNILVSAEAHHNNLSVLRSLDIGYPI